jgi:hypothetical protein
MTIINNCSDENGNPISLEKVKDLYWKIINNGENSKYESPLDRIKKIELSKLKGNQKEVIKYLSDETNYKKLINASIDEMKDIVKYFDSIKDIFWKKIKIKNGKTKNVPSDFAKLIIERLGYERFRDDGEKMIQFLNYLNIKSCPYCNSQYILTIDGKKIGKDGPKDKTYKKALFQLDHFFPKSHYPYLCVSFYNLIPCCSYCNNLKSSRDTTKEPTIHPYFDDYDEICEFKGDPESAILSILNGKKNPKINISIKADEKSENYKKASNHNEDFNVEALYQNHKDVVNELYWKSIFYNETRKTELIDFFKVKGISISEEEINRFITGNYTNKEDILKRPLSKLTKDIAKELGLLGT